jgi:ABC-type amino acid transport/signal transduction systems, periplasmic component/domain
MINQAIDQSKQDGDYKKIYEKWIGPLPAGA